MKIMRLAVAASALAVVAASEAQAQVELEITPFGGGTVFLADPPNQFALGRRNGAPLMITEGQFDDAWTLGVNAGVRLADSWAIEGLFSWIPTKLSATEGLTGKQDVNGYMYGLTVLYYFPLDGPVRPFLGVGGGGETFDYAMTDLETETEFMGNVAGGLYVAMSDGLGLRFEARDCFARFESGIASVDNAWENDLMITLGLSFRTALGG